MASTINIPGSRHWEPVRHAIYASARCMGAGTWTEGPGEPWQLGEMTGHMTDPDWDWGTVLTGPRGQEDDPSAAYRIDANKAWLTAMMSVELPLGQLVIRPGRPATRWELHRSCGYAYGVPDQAPAWFGAPQEPVWMPVPLAVQLCSMEAIEATALAAQSKRLLRPFAQHFLDLGPRLPDGSAAKDTYALAEPVLMDSAHGTGDFGRCCRIHRPDWWQLTEGSFYAWVLQSAEIFGLEYGQWPAALVSRDTLVYRRPFPEAAGSSPMFHPSLPGRWKIREPDVARSRKVPAAPGTAHTRGSLIRAAYREARAR